MLIVSLGSTSGANKIVRGSMDFCLFGEMTVAMIVNCSYNVPILIICFLRYSSLSLLPSLSLPLSHVSVNWLVFKFYLLNVNEVLLLC